MEKLSIIAEEIRQLVMEFARANGVRVAFSTNSQPNILIEVAVADCAVFCVTEDRLLSSLKDIKASIKSHAREEETLGATLSRMRKVFSSR